jgi:ribosomal protein S18 acetylase RimI-like enzyme
VDELVAAEEIGGTGIRTAVPGDDEELASVLVRAFEDDPIIRWVFPGDDEARRLYFRTNLELGHPHGKIFTADSRLGCAIWAPPGEWRVSLWTQLLLVPRIIRMLGVRRFQRGMMVFDRLQKEHQEGPHYYLGVLGVDPSSQGQGLGSTLVRAGLELADRAGVGAYLETSNPKNLPFYRRHGFEVTRSFEFAEGGPSCWLMWRAPSRREHEHPHHA